MGANQLPNFVLFLRPSLRFCYFYYICSLFRLDYLISQTTIYLRKKEGTAIRSIHISLAKNNSRQPLSKGTKKRKLQKINKKLKSRNSGLKQNRANYSKLPHFSGFREACDNIVQVLEVCNVNLGHYQKSQLHSQKKMYYILLEVFYFHQNYKKILYVKRGHYFTIVITANIQPCDLHVEFYLILPATP